MGNISIEKALAAYTFEYGKFRTRVGEPLDMGKRVIFTGAIFYEEAHVGSFGRTLLLPDSHGRFAVRHSRLSIDNKALQGMGFGRSFHDHQMSVYQSLGLEGVSICASGSVGCYAWAQMGFMFTDEDERADFWMQLKAVHEKDALPSLPKDWEVIDLIEAVGRSRAKELLCNQKLAWEGYLDLRKSWSIAA